MKANDGQGMRHTLGTSSLLSERAAFAVVLVFLGVFGAACAGNADGGGGRDGVASEPAAVATADVGDNEPAASGDAQDLEDANAQDPSGSETADGAAEDAQVEDADFVPATFDAGVRSAMANAGERRIVNVANGLVVDVEPDLTFLSANEAIDAGIEAGIWTEYEGTVSALGYFTGAVRVDEAAAFATASSNDFSHVVEHGRELLASGALDGAQVARLEGLLGQAMPPIEALEDLSSQATDGEDAVSTCTQLIEENYPYFSNGTDCFDVLERQGTDAQDGDFTFRVFHRTDDAVLAFLMMDTMLNAASEMDAYARIPNIDAVITDVGVGNDGASAAGAALPDTDSCSISIFMSGNAEVAQLENTVVHETVHCLQGASGMDTGEDPWIIEGGATFFAHRLAPSTSFDTANAKKFDARSLTTDLRELSYDAWVWWQYLANQSSPAAVWELQLRLSGGLDLASEPGMTETFHQFSRDYVAPGFPDSAGQTIRSEEWNYYELSEANDLDASADGFVVGRWLVYFPGDPNESDYVADPTKRYLPTMTGSVPTTVSWAIGTTGTQGGAPDWQPEIDALDPPGGPCTEEDVVSYAVVITAPVDHDAGYSFGAEEVSEESCNEDCFVGTFVVDLGKFNADLGFGDVVTVTGDDYFQARQDGTFTTWRIGTTYTIAGGYVSTSSSIEEGTWSTDGGRYLIDNIVTIDSASSAVIQGTPIEGTDLGSAQGAFTQTTAGDYTCVDDGSVLVDVEVPGLPALPLVTFNRVEGDVSPPTSVPR